MKGRTKICLIAGALVGLALLPVAYRHRHRAGQLIRKVLHARNPSPRSGGPITNSVVFNGKVFRNVLGYPPYYIDVPQLDSVLFVTRSTAAGSNLIHILNLKTDQEVQIPTIADFGRSIGSTNGGFLEYLERAEPGKISVASEIGVGVLMKRVYNLNLRTATMESRDTYYYDRRGNMTNSLHAPGF